MKLEKEKIYLELENDNIIRIKIPLYKYSYPKQDELTPVLIHILDHYLERLEEQPITNPGDDPYLPHVGSFYVARGTVAPDILTNYHKGYNPLDWDHLPEIAEFRKWIKSCMEDYYTDLYPAKSIYDLSVKAWGACHKPNLRISMHYHANTLTTKSLAGHYNFGKVDHNTATRYVLPVDPQFTDYLSGLKQHVNKSGDFVLMPGFVRHDTTPNRSMLNNRYSLGFTVADPGNGFPKYDHPWIPFGDL